MELPNRRRGFNQKLGWSPKGGGHFTLFATANYDESGALCEIWVDNMKVGSDFRAIVKAFARVVSKAIQNGVPPEEIVKTLLDYEPHEFPHVLGEFIKSAIPTGVTNE